MGFFGKCLNYRKFTDIKQAVYDYNKWNGSAVIYFNQESSRFWSDATNRLLARVPREPTAEDVVIVSKDLPPPRVDISIKSVKSMAENVLKEIENKELIEV